MKLSVLLENEKQAKATERLSQIKVSVQKVPKNKITAAKDYNPKLISKEKQELFS